MENDSRFPDHKWSCNPPPSDNTQSLCNIGRNPTQCKVFAVLYLKDALFCILLAKESQYHFAFKWEVPGEKHQQMTWTVLPQRFSDSPHLFGQTFSWHLLDLDLGPNGKLLKYVDDLLICSPDEKNAQQHAIQVLSDKGHLPGSSDYTWVQEAVLWSGTRNPPVAFPHDSKTIASFPGANWVL